MDTYFKKRNILNKKWKKKRSIFDFIDHWPVYVGKKNLARYIYILDLISKTNHIKGDICEFGSYKGANVFFISKILDILFPKNKKKVFSFESFKGMDGTSIRDNIPDSKKHSNPKLIYSVNYVSEESEFKDFLKLYKLKRIKLIKGFIEKTIPLFLRKKRKFSFLYHDIHFYLPTKLVLKHFHPLLSVGGYICFDEWGMRGGEGETKAVNEFLKKNKKKYKIINPNVCEQPSLVLKKIRA